MPAGSTSSRLPRRVASVGHAVAGRLERHEAEPLDGRRVQHQGGTPVQPPLLGLGDRPQRDDAVAQVLGQAEQQLGLAGQRVAVRRRRPGEHQAAAPAAAAQLGPDLEGEGPVLVQVRGAEHSRKPSSSAAERRRGHSTGSSWPSSTGSGSTPHDTTASAAPSRRRPCAAAARRLVSLMNATPWASSSVSRVMSR